MNPHQVTRDFEAMLCEYTGAPYAVAVNSCTMALTLAVAWHLRDAQSDRWDYRREILIPKRTYVSVPQAIIHAGGRPVFRDEDWLGWYQLAPLPVWDCARWFTSGMHTTGRFMCVSFHSSKTLGIEQGGAILHDNPEADAWFRRARFDGRGEGVAPKDDTGIIVGYHCYLNPSTAAQGILKLHSLPRHNAPLPNDDYPDLSTLECFR
jgi:dTDP-4-amino-4,6-dideoxygalactose transaminase